MTKIDLIRKQIETLEKLRNEISGDNGLHTISDDMFEEIDALYQKLLESLKNISD